MLRLVLASSLAWILTFTTAFAEPPFGSTGSDKPGEHKKDPTAAAFVLPSGTKLRKDQQTEFDKLKKDKGPALKKLIEASQSGSDEKEKTASAKEAMKLKSEIKAKITEILNKPDPAAKNMQPKQPKQQPKPKRR